jgi:hypothetical protein
MSNELKQFIDDNRNEFDDRVPSVKLWKNIEASFSPATKRGSVIRPFYKWTMAAAALLIISTGIYYMVSDRSQPAETVSSGPEGTGSDGPESLSPQMDQFVKMISMKHEELKTLASGQPELYQKFSTDLNQLDSSYNLLKNQLHAVPNREMLLEAMIQNLQLQLSVLNQQLNIINQIKQSKKNSHEKIDQSI